MHHRGFGNLKKIGCTKNGLSKKKIIIKTEIIFAPGDIIKSPTNGVPLNSSYNGRFHGLGSKCLITRVTVTVREKPCVTLWVGIPRGFS